MKKMILCCLAAVMIVCAAVIPASLADGDGSFLFNSYPVDVDALKALEQRDTFGVKVTRKVVTDGVDSSFKAAHRDMLSLTVENLTEATVTKLVIAAVAYDGDKNTAQLRRDTSSLVVSMGSGTAKRDFETLVFDSLSIAPGTSTMLQVPCTHSDFTGLRVLVAQYTDMEGQTCTNELYPEWRELALGSPTIILD